MGLEVGVHVLDGNSCGPCNPLVDTRDTETTLILRACLLATLNDPSVDEGLLEARTLWEALLHWVCIDDEEANGTSYLRCSQPNAIREIHRLPHVLDELG